MDGHAQVEEISVIFISTKNVKNNKKIPLIDLEF